MLILIGIIVVVLLLLSLLNQSVAWKQKIDIINGAGGVVFAIGKWVLGFGIISIITYAIVYITSHGEVFMVVASLVVGVAVFLVAVPYILNFKIIQRERLFESQIIEARHRRKEMGIPHYACRNYQDYITSSEWNAIAKHANQAMNGKCEFCGGRASSTHHVYYPKSTNDLGLENISTLCVACKKCHDVLHGIDAQCGDKCALCQKTKGTKKLAIKINYHKKLQQSVCDRCKAIATGFRDDAYQWSSTKYCEWIHEWQESIFADLMRQRNK